MSFVNLNKFPPPHVCTGVILFFQCRNGEFLSALPVRRPIFRSAVLFSGPPSYSLSHWLAVAHLCVVPTTSPHFFRSLECFLFFRPFISSGFISCSCVTFQATCLLRHVAFCSEVKIMSFIKLNCFVSDFFYY